MNSRYLLEIRVSHLVNNRRESCERKALPVTHSYRHKVIASSGSRDELVRYAERLPIEWFFEHERRYRVFDRLDGYRVCAER